jgi:hypothetical protein
MEKKQDLRGMHTELKRMTNRNKKVVVGGCIINKKGELLTNNKEINDRWQEYVTELFDDNRDSKPTIECMGNNKSTRRFWH